ncbi:hypothetical protein EOD42_08830 [Rhodovarius crocodyli]|uniref:Phage holin n=1 Tax=Rhodovarius crocodyli TaxID=1979269 RepID=A0A437MJN7_9PROT|nr:hypothetical protein [Rhodovarius crocodyli]RVT97884.1 hypothetical protein EOD42_08830 [Rhodovarius crocodyli]
MDQFVQALWGLAAPSVVALAVYGIKALRAFMLNQIQQRLGDGAARIAGEIIAQLGAGQPAAAPSVDWLDAAASKLRERFPDSTANLPQDTLVGMIRGELGKLGQAVPR